MSTHNLCFEQKYEEYQNFLSMSVMTGELEMYHHENMPTVYNFDPLKPHFYIVKLGFTRLYIIFLISAQKIDCGYYRWLEPPEQ